MVAWRVRYLTRVDDGFSSLVSSNDFSCAIETITSAPSSGRDHMIAPVQESLTNTFGVSYLAVGASCACSARGQDFTW